MVINTNTPWGVQLTIPPGPRANASHPAGVVKRLALADGVPDAFSIIQHLQSLVFVMAQQPLIREFTVGLIRNFRTHDDAGKIAAVVDFVRNRVRYVADPVEAEYVITPINLLTQFASGLTPAGDCDDKVLLLCSMLASIGYKTRIVGVSQQGHDFDHVIAGLWFEGAWRDIDPCDTVHAGNDYPVRLVVGNGV